MFLFWGVFAIGACTGMDWLVFLIPIIWFYSFFNVHNLKSLSEEEFYSIEDPMSFIWMNWQEISVLCLNITER